MKFTNFVTFAMAGLVAVPFPTLAFPALAKMNNEEILAMSKRFMESSPKGEKRQTQIPTVGRKAIPDADHPFQAPSSTAQRGPCPGLNIMANYGYINREGITDFNELLYGQQEFMGWALDLATLLASIAVAVDGNPVNQKVSIGGPDARTGTVPLSSGNTLPGGILHHNSYEIDASLTRDDVHIGSNKVLNGTLYQQIWEVADEINNGNVNEAVMTQVRSNRYVASAQDDPDFTFAPIGLLFIGADSFLYSTMVSSEESTGAPGLSNRTSLSAFYGANPTSATTWEYVPERLPNEGDWYRRSTPLTIPDVVADALSSLENAAEKNQLPIGVTTNDFSSASAFTCAIKQVVLGQIPASIDGLDYVGDFLTNFGSLVSTC